MGEGTGMSTGAKIGLAVGSALALGTVLYLTLGKKAAPTKGAGGKPASGAKKDLAAATAANVAAGASPADAAAQAAADSGVPGAIAVPPGGTSGGEQSNIVYVSKGMDIDSNGNIIFNGKVNGKKAKAAITADSNAGFRTSDQNTLYAVGDTVNIAHPNYNGQYQVVGLWDSGDGTGQVFVSVPFVASAGAQDMTTGGTISVVGTATAPPAVPADATTLSADGDYEYSFGSWIKKQTNSVKKNVTQVGNTIHKIEDKLGIPHKGGATPHHPIHFFSKAQAALRRNAQKIGKAQGLKGAALKNFLTHPSVATVATIVKGAKKSADGWMGGAGSGNDWEG